VGGAEAELLVVLARRLIDGTGQPPLDWPAVVVDDAGRLAYVGPRPSLPPLPPTVRWLDLGDLTLLPGIIDAHVHLVFDGGPDPIGTLARQDDAAALAAMAERATRMLCSGITTARDCGARGTLAQQLRQAIASGAVRGPRLVVSGAPLTVPHGHCHFLGGVTARGEAAVRAAAQRQLAAGADWVKLMVSGGRITPGSDATRPQFDAPEVRAAAAAAHAAGRRLAAHAHATASIAAAVTAGADSVEHCTWLGPDDTIAYDPAVADQMAARGIFACPTTHLRFQEVNSRRGPAWLEARLVSIGRLHAAGVPFAFGTDCGIPHVPHDRWAEGLVWLERAGLSPLAALHAATGGAARCLGLAAEVGTLTAGRRADLIAVEGDPARTLAALGPVRWVIQGGTIVVGGQAA